ncbi:HAMP domain-containing histidine kinase [Schnuerera sp. xch1]|uniref:sensor histidine kinase n=1 Tax=Schnuerera sp. xch1 TaxID=2874283 RepID=UPI001CBDEE4F|nr:HAMP domain-containing sensor histidine kinase [Schnuerera sp. xch1]MBZ2174757.1 HAMP domain-containing histidine kinase [Schnuerera sp. xch1]
MIIIYSLITILAFSVFSILILNNYKTTQIRNNEIRLFQTANIVAEVYKKNIDDIIFARMMVRSYGKQANSRILVLNSNQKVLIDNYHSYINDTINNQEIKSSLTGKSKSTLYDLKNKEVLQLSVPITLNEAGETRIIGAVLISADMNLINRNVKSLKNDMFKIACSALIITLLLTIVVTNNLTKPLRDLTYGVEKISSGDLGYSIKRKAKGEVGKLINTFNNMSNTLNKVEKNRKNFINNISHELKTPLTSIKVLIESLTMADNNIKTYKEYLKDIYNETDRMEKLVNYLMTSIKLEDIVLDMNEEDLNEILDDTVKLITPYAKKNDVSITLVNTENINVRCDKDRIKEVLFNLIDNAIKYRDDKKANNYISITLKKYQNKAIIAIEDNGIGIDEKNLEDIFKRNFRVLEGPTQSQNKIKGYGIGLTVVKNIIEKHNWKIRVESSLERGSIFTISVPL